MMYNFEKYNIFDHNYNVYDYQKQRYIENTYEEHYNFLKDLDRFYPKYKDWFYKKVLAEITYGNLIRHIIDIRINHRLAGVAILSRNSTQRKICSLKVHSDYKGTGLGLKLFDKSFDWLGTDKPFLTISDDMLPEFQKIFEYYNFSNDGFIIGAYRDGVKEHFYNTKNFYKIKNATNALALTINS